MELNNFLSLDKAISRDEMRKVSGGFNTTGICTGGSSKCPSSCEIQEGRDYYCSTYCIADNISIK